MTQPSATIQPAAPAAERVLPPSRMARDSAVYAIGGVVGKVAGVVLLPVLTRILEPASYGQLDLINTTGSALTTVLMLGMDAAVTRHFADAPTISERRRLVSTWVVLLAAVGVVAGLALLAGANGLATTAFGSTGAAPAITLLAVVVLGGLLNAAALNLLRLTDRPGAYATVSALTFMLNAGLAIAAAGPLRLGVTGVVGAWAVAVSLGAVAGLVLTRELVRPAFDAPTVRRLLGFGLPLVPALAVAWVAEVANRGVLLGAAGAGAVGTYSVALRIASLVGLAGTAFLLAWQPRAYAVARAEGGEWIAASVRGIASVLAGLVMGLTGLSILVVGILAGPGFEAAAAMVGPLALAAALTVLVPVLSVGSAIGYRPGDISAGTVLGLLSGLVLNLCLAPGHGAQGTAWAVAGGQLVGVSAVTILAQRRTRLPYRWSHLLALLLASGGAAAVVSLVPATPAVEAAACGFGLVFVVIGLRGLGETSAGHPPESTVDVYHRYRDSGYAARWGTDIPGNLLMAAERDRWLRDRLAGAAGRVVLDVGCGEAHVALTLDGMGARPATYIGVDLLEDRLAGARARVPWGTFLLADVRHLPLDDRSVDIAVAITLFSSLLPDELRLEAAAELRRVIRPGGRLLIYDIRFPSPRNPSVRPVTGADLATMFPGWARRSRSITLLPPIARSRLVRTAGAYQLLAAIPALRSHLATELIAPGRPEVP